MIYLLYLFGFLPSIIWLFFYLRKDAHPESNRMILKIFFFGMLAAFFAIFLEKSFQLTTSFLKNQKILSSILVIFLGGAFVEEYLKYLVVRIGVFQNPELDEPPDLLLYMIISALGFAALENILALVQCYPISGASEILIKCYPISELRETLSTIGSRFVSATFLHALSSGALGYFLALSIRYQKKRRLLFLTGLLIATLLHGLYNWPMMTVAAAERVTFYGFIFPFFIFIAGGYLIVSYGFKELRNKIIFLSGYSLLAIWYIWLNYPIIKIEYLLPVAILTGLAFFVSFSFNTLKRLKGICLIK